MLEYHPLKCWRQVVVLAAYLSASTTGLTQDTLPILSTEGQPLAANIRRVEQALQLLGKPLSVDLGNQLKTAADGRDHARLQTLLDNEVLLAVVINPESRVKVMRGPSAAVLQQGGYTPVLVKIINEST